MDYAAYLSYIFVTTFTPGPNNIMAMQCAGKYGFRKGLRFNLGVFFGFFTVVTICAAFTSLLYGFLPQIKPAMLYIGAAYILWLAWSVWRDGSHDNPTRAAQPNSMLSGIVLQFVNIKGILYGITAMSTFILPYYKGFWALSPFVLLMSLLSFASTCCWALFGAVFENLFHKYKKILNALLALSLLYCAVSLFFSQ